MSLNSAKVNHLTVSTVLPTQAYVWVIRLNMNYLCLGLTLSCKLITYGLLQKLLN